jgi:DNA mismatch endonuclease (patch repair protein)
MPKTNQDFWKKKLTANQRRDKDVIQKLKGLGWRAEIVWECETHDRTLLGQRFSHLLQSEKKNNV